MPNDFARRIKAPVYIIVAFLSVGSVLEVLAASWPLHLHDVNWRVGVLNTAAGATGTELLALLTLVVIAHLSHSRGGMWTAFSYSVIAVIGYVAATGLFALDSLQLRGHVPAAQLSRFDVTVAWAVLRFAIADLVCLWLGVSALTSARAMGRELAREASDRRNALIVGSTAGVAPAPRIERSSRTRTPRQGLKVGS